MAHESCGHCHYAFFHGVPTLDCRRKSPSVGKYEREWPQVSGSDWCGDFKLAEDESGNIPEWMKK